MKTLNWRGRRLQIQTYNVQSGTYQLELRRCHLSGGGVPVVMVAGFLGNNELFMSGKGEGGLAPFLASLGYDVFLAELRGRGSSWPLITSGSDWGAGEAIREDLPAHLQMVSKLRPGEPQVWIGQDFSSLLLSATYARCRPSVPVLGMVHFSPTRRLAEQSRGSYRRWQLAIGLASPFKGFASRPFVPGFETIKSFNCWRQWHHSETWSDPDEDLDYGKALRALPLPPSLYFANESPVAWGRPDDCRRWIAELGDHDARLITVGRRGGNRLNYSNWGLLQHPQACEDHFLQLQDWLSERSRMRASSAANAG